MHKNNTIIISLILLLGRMAYNGIILIQEVAEKQLVRPLIMVTKVVQVTSRFGQILMVSVCIIESHFH